MALRSDNPTAVARPSRRRLANAIRMLSMDAVEAARSGHPGMPMGMADIAEVLWNDYLKFNPANGHWHDRDRFVLSNGHGSMLLYSVAYLSGYDIRVDELKNFRQLGSRVAGHPERELTIGIETTTGPLGQGLANAVGMALAEKHLAAEFNREDCAIVDHYTYVFLGDGCLMEGISHEACSFAGTQKLGKLIAFYDDNGISIDGETRGWFTDDTPKRFSAYGWHVVPNVDGHDAEAILRAIEAARAETNARRCFAAKPSSATVRRTCRARRPRTARRSAPPKPLRRARPWDGKSHRSSFRPTSRRRGTRASAARGAKASGRKRFTTYRERYPDLAAEFERRMRGALPPRFRDHAEKSVEAIAAAGKAMATRKASQLALEAFAPVLPELVGGSADLTGSNNTLHKYSKPLTPSDASGNYLYYGVREFGMAAMMNGMAAHGGVIPYGGTFLVFSDYARNGLRMAALIGLRSIFVLTHDSIGLGEDGPTHQPIEHLASLRLMPNMDLWRPCDTVETAVAWAAAVERQSGPTCLVLTRQDLPHVPRTSEQVAAIARGGYIVSSGADAPAITVIATGSEVQLAVGAARELEKSGVSARVVSMPCTQAFDRQPDEYRDHVLPPGGTRLVVEAGATGGWWRYVGARGNVLGLDRFGHSAPAKPLFEHFGFTVDAVVAAAKRLL